MNSIHESLWHGVPMVCVPHIGDQLYNASVVQDAGAGVMVDAYDVTVESLREAVNEVRTRTSHRTPSHAFGLGLARIGASLYMRLALPPS